MEKQQFVVKISLKKIIGWLKTTLLPNHRIEQELDLTHGDLWKYSLILMPIKIAHARCERLQSGDNQTTESG